MRPFGRDRELDAIDEQFAAGARVVVVTGTAGVGKSTIARAIAAEEGTDLVSLRGVRTRAALEALLRPGTAGLLAFDDAEDLDEDARLALHAAMVAAPSLRLLVASRVVLHLPDEHVVRVEPFDEARTIDLLTAIARRANPRFEPGEAIGDLARAVGGLPLAIELAARRLPLVGAKTLVERHKSIGVAALDRAVESSLGALEPHLSAIVERLAVLEAPFDLAFFERVTGAGIDALEALHDRSLLRTDDARHALYDAVRDAALRHLRERGAEDEIRLAIAEHAIAHALALSTAVREGEAAARKDLIALARDLEWIASRLPQHAARAVLALDPVGRVVPGFIALLGEAEAASRGTSLHAAVLATRGRAHFQAGSIDRGEADMMAALAEDSVDPASEAIAASKAAFARLQRGAPSEELYERADRAATRANQPWVRAIVDRDRALGYMRAGRDAEAQALLERALATGRFGLDLRALLLASLAQLHQNRGELEVSVARFREAIEHASAAGEQTLVAWSLATSSAVEIELGRFADARRNLDKAVRIATEAGSPTFLAMSYVMLGQLAHETGELSRAVVAYHQAIPVLRAVKQQRGVALSLAALGAAEAALGHADLARARIAEARRELTAPRAGDDVTLDAFEAIVETEITKCAADPSIADRAKRVPSSDELRMALRLLAGSRSRSAAPPPPIDLRIGAEGAWFETAAGRSLLPARSPLRRVLVCFARARIDRAGAALGVADIFAFAWPDERAIPAASTNRVKVAINTLRRAGLKDLLETVPNGYRLDPEKRVVLED